MRFTDEPAPGYSASPMGTLQVFSVKVAGMKRSLQWPVDVFSVIAARDCIDNNRNIMFSRTRDRCQTLTAEVNISQLSFIVLFVSCYTVTQLSNFPPKFCPVCLLLYCDSAI